MKIKLSEWLRSLSEALESGLIILNSKSDFFIKKLKEKAKIAEEMEVLIEIQCELGEMIKERYLNGKEKDSG